MSVGDTETLPGTAFNKILKLDMPGTPIESAGSWEALVKGLVFKSEQELSSYIKGKTVLDVGSGMGGLFKGSRARGVDAKIVNINPRFSIKGFVKSAHEIYEEMATSAFENIENIKDINKEHDEYAIAAFSNKLPIKDASVDIIIDNKGAVYHCIYEDRIDENAYIINSLVNPDQKALSETIDEYMRVLRIGGKARIGGLLPQQELEDGLALLENLLAEKGLKYMVIKDEEGENVAVEIEKSEHV